MQYNGLRPFVSAIRWTYDVEKNAAVRKTPKTSNTTRPHVDPLTHDPVDDGQGGDRARGQRADAPVHTHWIADSRVGLPMSVAVVSAHEVALQSVAAGGQTCAVPPTTMVSAVAAVTDGPIVHKKVNGRIFNTVPFPLLDVVDIAAGGRGVRGVAERQKVGWTSES